MILLWWPQRTDGMWYNVPALFTVWGGFLLGECLYSFITTVLCQFLSSNKTQYFTHIPVMVNNVWVYIVFLCVVQTYIFLQMKGWY